MKILKLSEVSDILFKNDNFALLTHQYPDGDTLGSAFALCRVLQKIGKHAKVLCNDNISTKFDYMYNSVDYQEFEESFVVSVDIADTQLLGEKLFCYSDNIDLCIDHHASNTNYAKNSFVNSDAAATAEIVAELINEMGINLDKEIAECIYTGLSTDTGCFKYSNASSKTYRIAAEMIESGARSAYINRLMFDTKSKQRVELEKLVLNTLEFFCDDKCAVVYVTKDMQAKAGVSDDDIEGISSIPRKIQGVIVGITLREKENGSFKISLRTNGSLNASEICKQFGGGGHPAAAGCTIFGELDTAKADIVNAVCKEIKKSCNEWNNNHR